MNELIEVDPRRIRTTAYHQILSPVRRDTIALAASMRERGFLADHPLTIRPAAAATAADVDAESYVLVTGLQRLRVAEELRLERVYALVKHLSEADAQTYALDEAVRDRDRSVPMTVVHALLLAEHYAAERQLARLDDTKVGKLSGFGPAHVKRARPALRWALDRLRQDPKVGERMRAMPDIELVANVVTSNIWPEFTQFVDGTLGVQTFRRDWYDTSAISERRRGALASARAAQRAKAEGRPESATQRARPASRRNIYTWSANLNHVSRRLLPALAAELEGTSLPPQVQSAVEAARQLIGDLSEPLKLIAQHYYLDTTAADASFDRAAVGAAGGAIATIDPVPTAVAASRVAASAGPSASYGGAGGFGPAGDAA